MSPSDSQQKKNPTDESIPPANSMDGESLEYSGPSPADVITPASASSSNSSLISQENNAASSKPPKRGLHALWDRFNIYLLLFVLVLVVAVVVVAVSYFKNKAEETASNTISSQNLSAEALQELANSGVQVGDPKQVLNIQSNAVFNGAILVKGELQVAGGIKVGSGNLTLPGINAETANINELQTRNLAVAGNTAVQGQLTVQRNLTVNGGGTFNGALSTPQLTTGRLQLNGDFVLTRHLLAGGSIPGRSNGGALGSGGTSSVSGSDTSGSISIHTGSGTSSGCFITIQFSQAFNSTPHVVVTPIGSAAAGINYYVNRSTGSFSVCTTNAAPANQNFGFDYIALG